MQLEELDEILKDEKRVQELWDSLTPEKRRREVVGNSFMSFKNWERLNAQEQRKVVLLLKDSADTAAILIELGRLVRQFKRM